MYKLTITMRDTDYISNAHFIEFQDLAQVFLFIDMYERHTKFSGACSYIIEYVK